MAENLDQTIKENASGPKRAQGDSGSVELHNLKDQLEVDRYLNSKAAAKKKGLGIRMTRAIPPGTTGLEYNRIPANAMIHYFRVDRPGQCRGVPDITPALPLFAQLRRFTLAVISAAETAADFAGVLQTDAPPDGEADLIEPMDTVELEQRMLLTLPGGWKMAQIKAEQPSTTYGEFKREILNEIACCLNMPFNVAAGNSSGYNYASGRLDHQTYFKSIHIEQAHIERCVLDRIFNVWLDEAVLVEGLLPLRCQSVWHRLPHDPRLPNLSYSVTT